MNKQEIIEEIKRTAKANGGIPLGSPKFSKETGIKEHIWRGKHWVKWSDALQESGFEPNQFNKAYETDFLIEQFILLIRELGRFPTKSECLFKANSDDNFPSYQTFQRLGSKSVLAGKIVTYCKERTNRDDIISICEPISATQKEIFENNADANIKFGYVYLIKSGKSGNTYKIGWSKNSTIRQYQLQTGSPEPLNLIHEIKTDDPSGIERYWHKRFAPKRTDPNKEWFRLNSDNVRAFKRMKFA